MAPMAHELSRLVEIGTNLLNREMTDGEDQEESR